MHSSLSISFFIIEIANWIRITSIAFMSKWIDNLCYWDMGLFSLGYYFFFILGMLGKLGLSLRSEIQGPGFGIRIRCGNKFHAAMKSH